MTCMALFKTVSYLINIPKNENINIMKTRVASDTAIKDNEGQSQLCVCVYRNCYNMFRPEQAKIRHYRIPTNTKHV